MQFVGQTYLLRVPLPDARPSRETPQSRFEAAYHARFRVHLPEIRPAPVNLATTVTGLRPPLDSLATLLDPTAAPPPSPPPRPPAGRSASPAAGTTPPSTTASASPPPPPSPARRSSSRWTPPPSSPPATGRSRTPTATC